MVVAHYDGDNLLVDGEVVPRYEYDGDNHKRNTITSVTFPEGLQSIGSYAFHDCPLTSVIFPEGLQSIGDGAFHDCPLTRPQKTRRTVSVAGALADVQLPSEGKREGQREEH